MKKLPLFTRKGMLLSALLCLLCVALPSLAAATAADPEAGTLSQQKLTVRGRVVDAAGIPVIGAGILESGTRNGTITDSEGNWQESAPHALRLPC